MAFTRIGELASILSTNVSQIDEYLSAHELPTPSFDPEIPASLFDGVRPLQQAALRAMDELHALLVGQEIPGLTSHNSIVSTLAINRFKIAQKFPKDRDEASYGDMGRACGLSEPVTRRIVRHAMTKYVFRESRPGFVAHTAMSKRLATDSTLQVSLSVFDKEDWPSASRLIDAVEKWPEAQEPTETGYQLANGTDEPVFDFLAHKHPDRAQTFARLMNMANSDPKCSSDFLLNGFPWAELGQGATIVDVGGGYGHVSIALTGRYPSLRCLVQDRPEIIAKGSTKVPAGLDDKVTFMAHDFFSEQPRKGANVYLLRWILHDWSDKYAIKILRALVPALKPGARVIVNDAVMPVPGTLSPFDERAIREFDFTMWHYQNGKEREAEEWKKLFQEADTLFDLIGITHPHGSALAIIEVMWRGNQAV